ncbi:polyketide synthase [Colletotrichum chrysophilum]|uniref:Polyketide synthase n=1 Tax=Colletotrichum chrysophilum TaxID=1836956 RepID=A0AAD9A7C6_9PEZI|nr:polyketide synthase [Colletotrichum chrysophilum]
MESGENGIASRASFECAKSAFSRVPEDRFDHESFHYSDSAKPGALSAKGAYFLPDDIYAFDAPFFNITAEEAVSMDPQIRVLLECAFEAAESAGLPLDRLSGSKTGVFSAQEEAEYGQQMIEDLPTSTKYCITGNAGCMVSNRLSYFFNLRGPNISLDSACSSSGYAVHMACQSLRAGECETAFVGASSLMVNHHTMSQLDTLGALSSDVKCFSYDSRANGFGRGEGASCLILKRLDMAIEAGDPVHAVIRNSAANHSGRTRGITLPSQVAQEELLWRLHQEVGLKPAETDVVEGHGTRTPVGDPIDASAAANVIGRDREGKKVYLGSLKSNFGHLHSASGLLSVIKAAMMVRIFPNAEFETMNPKIDSSRLEVVRRPTPWISPESRPRRAVVTNFGFGGSNAAVLIEEYKADENPSSSSSSLKSSQPSQMLFPISAQSLASLSSYQSQVASHLEKVSVDDSSSYLGDLGYTLGLRRTHFAHRMALVAGSLSELREQLVSPSLSSTGGRVAAGQKPAPCFVFTGQGAQSARMAADLGPQYPVFAKAMEDAEKHLRAFGATWSLAEELAKSEGSRINEAEISQPACTAVQLGLVERIANAQGIFNRRLRINVAYHSHHMERVASSYVAAIEPYFMDDRKSRLALNGDYEKKRVLLPLFSSVTGQVEGAEAITSARYWAKNLVSPVRFSEAVTLVANESSANVLVEIGPHAALKGPINQTLQSLEQKKDSITRHRVLADLPSYEWDKKARFIHRSSVSVGKCHSGHTFTPLLGWKMASQGRDHVFRQVFTLDELPWVRDHKVVGDVLFPFTGFLSLAVDAFRSITTATVDPATSFSICEMHIERGLHIKEEQRVDICTKLRPVETGTGHLSSSTWAFEVMTWSEQTGWVTHVHGRIEAGSGEKCFGASESPVWQAAEKILKGVNAAELDEATALSGYDTLDQSGVCYGSSFKNIFEMWRSPGKTVHRTRLRQTNDEEPLSIPKRGSAMTVDPPMLDSVLSSALLAVGDGLPEPRPAFVPTYVRRMQLSNTIPCEPGQLFTTVSHRKTFQEKTGRSDVSIVVWADGPQGSNERVPCVEMELTYQRINDAGQEGEEHVKQTLPRGYQEVLVPHVDLSDNKALSESIMDRSWTPEELLPRHKHNAVGRHFLKRAIEVAAGLDETTLPKHLKAFLVWAGVQVRSVDDEPEASAELLQEVARDDAFGELICAVGNAIPEILRGEVEPLEVMMKDGLLMKHYDDIRTMARGNQALARYIAKLGELNPDLRIIEVGAGTGAATTKVLQALSAEEPEEEDNFSAYTYTDISPGFFDAARKKLARWPQVTHTKLDISQDPAEQGIEVGIYDVVIASNVLHATQDIEETVRNIGSLLRPGTGKLAIVESLPESCDAAFLPYTILPGWWLTENSWRQGNDGPLMSQETWDRLLVTLGFNGVEGAVADWPGADICIVKTMWSTKLSEDIQDEEEESDAAGEVTICGTIIEEQRQLAGAVQSKLEHLKPQIIKSVPETQQISDKFCIFLDCGETSFLADIATEEAFAALRAMVLDTRGLLWMTPDSDSPDFARVQGLLRTLRLEDPTKKLLWLSKAPTSDPTQTAELVDKLTERLVKDSSSSPAELLEQDFVWQDGMFQVPRLRRLPETTRTFAIEKGLSVRREQNLWDGSSPNSALFMTMDTPGVMDSVYFKRHDLMRPAEKPLGDDEIIVKVDACGINFRDVLALLNTIPWSLPGREGAGTVVAAGANVSHVRPGDSVIYMIAQGGLATHVRIPAAHACKLPSGLSPAEAASMAVAYVTALVCLDDVSRLRPGESVLVHAASGAVGQACVRIAQSMGATVFATAGSEEKRTFVHETLGVPREHIYSSRKRGFAAGILNVTGGRGVDVVVNSLSGELLQDTWSIVTEFGRFVEIGKKDILANSHLGMRQFERNVSFFAVDLVPYLSHKSDSIQACLAKMVSLFEAKVIQPIQPIHEVPVSDIVSGFRALQSGQNIGKIVAIMGKDDRVVADVASPLRRDDGSALLRGDATYLITGGTGGIGKSLVPWMLGNGASNVVVLGRSATNAEVAKLISDYDSPSTMIHVRSMYLRDSIFFNASFDDWKTINGPKIVAAWNLHHLLPDLDFFVALASGANVVGNVGQSIYCQTSSFLDAFAQWRSRAGKPTISISLPVVDDVGYVIQQGMREQLLEKLGFYISIAQVHTVIKGAIIGPSSGLNIDSRAIAFVLYDSPQGKSHGLEERSRYLSALRQKKWRKNKHALDNHGDGEVAAGGRLSLLDALAGKVSSITMMSREDVTPTRSLIEYGLDSLVSVELRNWIKREYGADLALTQIVGAPDLQALADVIVTRQKA